MDLGLAGKRAVVTGGSRGIGLAIAGTLAAEGADIALLARDPARLDAARQRLAASGRRVLALSADTTDDAAVRAAIARAAAPYMIASGWGRIINISGLAARSAGLPSSSIRNVASRP